MFICPRGSNTNKQSVYRVVNIHAHMQIQKTNIYCRYNSQPWRNICLVYLSVGFMLYARLMLLICLSAWLWNKWHMWLSVTEDFCRNLAVFISIAGLMGRKLKCFWHSSITDNAPVRNSFLKIRLTVIIGACMIVHCRVSTSLSVKQCFKCLKVN